MWGISRGFVLIQDGGDHSYKDFWVNFGTLEWTKVFRYLFNPLYCHLNQYIDLRLRYRWPFVSLLRRDNQNVADITYGML